MRHGVIQLRYAIFPQQSGELSIPAQAFSATPVERSNGYEFNPFGPRPGGRRGSSRRKSARGEAAPGQLASRCALAAGARPDPERGLEPGAQGRDGRRLAHPQPDAARRGPVQRPARPLADQDSAGLRRYPDQPQQRNEVNDKA